MFPGMKFYIVSIVAVFTALGIGIYIGFAMDTGDFVNEQQEGLITMLESQFEILREENINMKEERDRIEIDNKNKDEYINASYEFLINDRLKGLNVGIIETNSDYTTSGIGKDLELAGANVVNLTTINKVITEKENLEDIIIKITKNIINGEVNQELENLETEDLIEMIGNYNIPVDYLVICGGGFENSSARIKQIDKNIIKTAKQSNIGIIGVEKSEVEYSYMGEYIGFDIPTVDNIDMTIGKVAMILTMEGLEGNYGIKSTSKNLFPSSKNIIYEGQN